MDLMNLNEELKHGKILSSGKSLVIMTPLARLDFCELAQPAQFQDRGSFRYGVELIFETDSAKLGAVDVKKILIPALFEFARANHVTITERKDPGKRGYVLGGDKLTIRVGQRMTSEGDLYSGYETSSVSIHAANTPKVQTPPWAGIPCVSPQGESGFSPTAVYDGCYGRAIINPYKPKKWSMVAIGLLGVQMIADGDPLGSEGSRFAMINEFGAVAGASVQSSFERGLAESEDTGVAPAVEGDLSSFIG